MKQFSIGEHCLGKDGCYIIAEVGSNHDKNKSRAFKLIKESALAGANAVKFQLFQAEKIAADMDIPETRLNDQFSRFGKNVYSLYKNMELPKVWLKELSICCKEHKVDFLVTPFDEHSADLVAEIGVLAMKIASFEITHIPLLAHVAKMKLPVLLSTGMANMVEIRAAIRAIQKQGEYRIALFHCGIDYPMPYLNVNLRCMERLRNEFSLPVGYSDHTRGISVPIASVAMGASIYEKHITLIRGKSPDHSFALNAHEFRLMVRGMRECEQSLGSMNKIVQSNELVHLKRGRRSIFVVKDVMKGQRFCKDNLSVLRPGIGLAPRFYFQVLGKEAVVDIKAPALLKRGDWG